MNRWVILGTGFAALTAVLYFPLYEPILAAVASVSAISAVIFGFLLRPSTDVFFVNMHTYKLHDGDWFLEHDCVAVRIELARLWMIFIPTFAALAVLIVTSAQGRRLRFSILEFAFEAGAAFVLVGRALLVVMVAAITMWVSERRVMRNSDACSARTVDRTDTRVLYSFVDESGEFYGGEGFHFNLNPSPELARLVFYNRNNPQLNKIGMSLFFHRLVVIGHGITDLDQETIRHHAIRVSAAES